MTAAHPMTPPGEAAKRIARHGTEAERATLASLPGTAPELLYYLAQDTAFAVRAAIAANAATPPQADRLLAADEDPRVRAILGRKLAGLAPALGQHGQDRLRRLAWQTLCRLAADAAMMVRRMIAEEMKAMPDAPRDLILGFARDTAMEVAEPVIRFSPLLTEEDLLALVLGPPVRDTVVAVARRPALSEAVSDAIAATEDPDAVAALLENPSAAIREATLDALISRAGPHLSWQERLVVRPGLPPAAARALARCVADHLLETLASRPDLGAELAATLRERLHERLEGTGPAPHHPTAAGAEPWTPACEATGPAAQGGAAGAPDAEIPGSNAFAAAAKRGDRGALARLLGQRAGVAEETVLRAARLRSAKGLVSLCWKAGLTPRCALLAQTVMAGIAPALALVPEADGGWPLREEEMAWQIELLTEAPAC